MNHVDLVVWMNQPSHYQSAFFDELAAHENVTLSVLYARRQTLERRRLGWTDTTQKNARFSEFTLTSISKLRQIVYLLWKKRNAIHVVNGVWAEKWFMLAVVIMILTGTKFYFHSEAPDPKHEKGGVLKCVKYLVGGMFIGRCAGMFLIGDKGCRYYQNIGAHPERLFKFSYFVHGSSRRVRNTGGCAKFSITYVGQFVERKRVEDLICAVEKVSKLGIAVYLRIIGHGPLREKYQRIAKELLPAVAVDVEGPLLPKQIDMALSESDVLVLPSAFDGWGLTVNEALHCGVPVVVSDGCGAAELVDARPDWGVKYPAGDIDALAKALFIIATSPLRFTPKTAEVSATIGCRYMTEYFLNCIRWGLVEKNADARPSLCW